LIANAGRGLIRSTDYGNTWSKVANAYMVWNIIESDGILLGCGENGMHQSTDKGKQWQRMLTKYGSVRIIKKIGDRLVMSSDGQPNQNEVIGPLSNKVSRLHYSDDNGKTWKNMDEKISINNNIREIVQQGNFIFCSHEKGISRTADWGKTWELVLAAPEKKGYELKIKGDMLYCMQVEFYGC
jgi:photosystem II stability/assembly factor-like uncharacterized protein